MILYDFTFGLEGKPTCVILKYISAFSEDFVVQTFWNFTNLFGFHFSEILFGD